jgi:hypothetical protein
MAQVAKMRAAKSRADVRAEQQPSPPIAQTVAVAKPVAPPATPAPRPPEPPTPAPPPPMPDDDLVYRAWLDKTGRGGR